MIQHVYIHIPFCVKKCGYCSFFSLPYKQHYISEYISFLKKEIELYSSILNIRPQTIYIGGGTPSLLEASDIGNLLSSFNLSDLIECTIEVNPATLNKDKVKMLSLLPVNRVSIGMQSFNDKELKLLGRLHSVEDSIRSFNLFRDNGFENISIDIMYGIPDTQSKQTSKADKQDDYTLCLSTDIEYVKLLNPDHVSFYGLSLAPETPMSREGHKLPADEICADSYRYLTERIIEIGIEQYEISNFAKKGFESLHNLGYWKMDEYIGFGAGSHSLVNSYRYHNPESLSGYYGIIRKQIMFPDKLPQTEDDLKTDFIIQALRLTAGINYDKYRARFKENLLQRYSDTITKYKDYLIVGEKSLRLKPDSYFVSNEIIAAFLR